MRKLTQRLLERLLASALCVVLMAVSGAASLTLLGHVLEWATFLNKMGSLTVVVAGLILGALAVFAALAAFAALFDPNFLDEKKEAK